MTAPGYWRYEAAAHLAGQRQPAVVGPPGQLGNQLPRQRPEHLGDLRNPTWGWSFFSRRACWPLSASGVAGHAILRSPYPGAQAVDALAVGAPVP
jgi:hypothetical protein